MIETVADVTLRGGQTMTVKVVQPPEPDYAEKLCRLLEHKGDSSFRAIRQRLGGQYARECIDRYFVGEVDGRIVGQAWYGLPRGGTGIGNFGHVYTEREMRGKGVATHIVRLTVEDFARSEGKCLLCGAARDSAAIYCRLGFELIVEGAESGPAALVKKSVADSFRALEEDYFQPGPDVTVRPGTIADRHDCDRMLDFSPPARQLARKWHRVFMASRVPTFMDALYMVEDGRGLLTVAESARATIVGYAFALNLGSEHEDRLRTLDLAVHPNYLDQAARLASETASMALAAGTRELCAFVAECDEEKLTALAEAGFREAYRFKQAFLLDDQYYDVLGLRFDAPGALECNGTA